MTKKEKKENGFVCSLCGQADTGFGHNPEPLKPYDQRCCTMCNATQVIPARLHNVYMLQAKPREEAKRPDDYMVDEEQTSPPLWSLSDDPYYNLLGALHDLEQGVNDKVVHETLRRVLFQIKPKRLKP